MLAISLLIAVLVGGINVFSFIMTADDNAKMLSMLTDVANAPDKKDKFDDKPTQTDKSDAAGNSFQPGKQMNRDPIISARYFSITFDESGNITKTDISHISSVSDEDAKSIAAEIYKSGSTDGRYEYFDYRITDARDSKGRILIMLDTSAQISSFFSTLFISICAGAVCWILMLLLIMLLSKKAIKPIAENIEKQKQFVTNAGHEIKTPLAIILANTDAMELIGGETKWSKNIRAQVLRLSGLMQNLLTLAKMDEDSAKIPMCDFDLSTAAEDTVSAFIEPAAQKGIMIDIRTESGVTLRGSKEHIIQLLTVLMDNAVKYTCSGGEISYTLTKQDKAVIMQIKNTCEHIENPDKLFDRFYRGDSARTQKNGGYGIGLSVAQSIVQLHKGSIGAESGEDFLAFKIRLPIS